VIADGSANSVGAYSSLALDAQGNAHVSYQDFSTGDLKYASAAVHLLSPASGVTWAVGSRQEVTWAGVGTVDLYLASDGSGYETLLADNVMASPISVRVPHVPTPFARLILVRSSPFSTSATDSFFEIDATIALAKFDAARGSDGAVTRLAWETRPGPEADIRYRVERADGEAGFVSLAAGLDRSEFVDPSPATASRYRLIAVNGLGEEYVLGEASAAPGIASGRDLAASPNPSSGPVEILYRVRDGRRVDLAIYDASGRLVRSIDPGTVREGIQAATWDRRDDSGRDVAAGTYFIRLAGPNGYGVMERLTIVR
jgi:hypothetical protein